MRVSGKAIVLQSIKHGDRQSIVKLYTLTHGLITVIASPGRTPASRIRASSLLPLTLLDVVYTLRENRDINRLLEASCYYVHEGMNQSLAKLSIAQFMNEVLLRCLKEQSPNAPLFHFIEGSLTYLNDAQRDFLNLPLYFLRELAAHLGFEPHNNFDSRTAAFFDMREGAFSRIGLPFPLGLSAEDSARFSSFLATNPLREQFSPGDRNWLLEIFLAMYRLHVPNFPELKSLQVLRELAA